ncbi:MAG TPA: alpha/beta hydrolase-fold protein [Opitutaceae bacterium]|nr:alpha/beta hydrolase-fold protein [Opitutaceae bacterium]
MNAAACLPVCVRRALALAALGAASLRMFATPYTLANTDLRELPPSANGRQYLLYVGLPSGYATDTTRRYPVVYFPDAYWDFNLLNAVLGNLRADYAAPDVILVGIGYAGASPDYGALRALDLTPGVDPSFDPVGNRSGRAAQFVSVLETEIFPFVEREYRTMTGYRVLAGNSFGGLFAVYVALEHSHLFQGYVASSPALWWRNYGLAAREAEIAASASPLSVRLYLAYATGDGASITESTRAFYQQLKSHHHPNAAIALRVMEGERHSSLKPEAYTRGMRFALAPVTSQASLAGTTMRPNLVNLSTRGWVGTGDSVLIAGFVIDGFESKRVLVRAAGPALADFNVGTVLADPLVRVQTLAGVPVAANDNWENTPDLTLAIQRCGAFPFRVGSRDAAVLVTLPPGAYTALVSGSGDATGNGEVEVYELP